jgi:hypothetical protein
MAFFGMAAAFFPPFKLYTLMTEMGGGLLLKNWSDMARGGYWQDARQLNYLLVGVPKAGIPAVERLSFSSDRMDGDLRNPAYWTSWYSEPAAGLVTVARIHKDFDVAGDEVIALRRGPGVAVPGKSRRA